MTTNDVVSAGRRPDPGLLRRTADGMGSHFGSRLFRKYVALFVAVVSVALLTNGLFEIWFSYQENKEALTRIQREQAIAAAGKISQYIKDIEGQIGWTTQLPWTASALEQRRFDALRLLRQVPAITELAQLDASGKEQLRVSRLAMDAVGVGTDFSKDPKFTEAVAKKIYYGPVYFRRESEPYMTLAMAGARRDAGVSVAEVNLKFIWEVVSQIKVGQKGQAFVIDGRGRLIAHPDISLVLRNTDMYKLGYIKAASEAAEGPAREGVEIVRDIQGREVLTAHAPILPLRWLMFVELPIDEAYAPLYVSIQRSAWLLAGGLALALLAAMFLARKMIIPIQQLREGAAQIGSGNLEQRISIKTGDELERLADQFNDMAGRLEESYAGLEQKVEQRTSELSESLQQQTATSDVLQVISGSPGDLDPVFQAILQNAVRICEAKFGVLLLAEGGAFRTVSLYGAPPEYVEARRQNPIVPGAPGSGLARVAETKKPVQIADVQAEAVYQNEATHSTLVSSAGARTLLTVPMLKEDDLVGAIAIYRQEVRPFTDKQAGLVTNFANQAVIAIENTRLLSELRARTDELARSVGELQALGEVSQAVNSTLDLETVLTTIVQRAVQLSRTDAGAIYVFDEERQEFKLRATYGMSDDMIVAITDKRIGTGDAHIGPAAMQRKPVQVPDIEKEPPSRINDINLREGYRALLIVPLLRPGHITGALVVRRRDPGEFAKSTIDLLETFAGQSVVAIENANLFHEIEEKGKQLAIASQHKSQFLANMSHELRTPLNAILGYTELILDGIYGDTPEKAQAVLKRVESNGRHLLGLINDVLDLSKIEAGQLTLSLTAYSMKDVLYSVYSAVEPLASTKSLNFKIDAPGELPKGHGDERRLTQVILNLVGNAIKFTDQGDVIIKASANNGTFTVAVKDTGPGISQTDQAKIFEEFQQADNSATKKKGGTGLGLSISRRIVEMHGGRLWVESEVGQGSVFQFTLPVEVQAQVQAQGQPQAKAS
nr:GAF domain-containing protein [Rhodoplanes sp. Z2-YC6860]